MVIIMLRYGIQFQGDYHIANSGQICICMYRLWLKYTFSDAPIPFLAGSALIPSGLQTKNSI